MSKETAQWFVIQTQANKELQVEKRLQAALKEPPETQHIFEVMVPIEKVSVVKHEKKTVQVRKIFPCYVFVKMDLYEADGVTINKDAWYAVRNTQGVLGFAGHSEQPRPLRDVEFLQIRERVQESEGRVQAKFFFPVDSRVRINAGPFASLVGVVKQFDAEGGRLDVNVSIFGRETPVSLEHWQVEAIKEDEK
jgi:transcriptional antiterminator NusG